MNVLNEKGLAGRMVVVTGGVGHVGRAMVEKFALAGARVIAASRSAQRATAWRANLIERELDVHLVRYDQASETSARRLFNRARKLGGGNVDILVNNAVVWPMKDWRAPLKDFSKSMAVNATGLFAITRMFGEEMSNRGSGAIVNIASIFAAIGPDFKLYRRLGVPGAKPDYFFHKAGMIQMTRYFAALWGVRGIRVNALCLGPIDTGQDRRVLRALGRKCMLERVGRVDEAAQAAVFLASDSASFMTGSVMTVDGGYTAW